jgi:hypothetical protein
MVGIDILLVLPDESSWKVSRSVMPSRGRKELARSLMAIHPHGFMMLA